MNSISFFLVDIRLDMRVSKSFIQKGIDKQGKKERKKERKKEGKKERKIIKERKRRKEIQFSCLKLTKFNLSMMFNDIFNENHS